MARTLDRAKILLGALALSTLNCSGTGSSLTFGHPAIDFYRSSLVAYYRMSETAGNRSDATGSHELTDGNAVGSGTGKSGTGADFEASSSNYLTRNNSNTLKPNFSFALSLWIKPESQPASTAILFESLVGTDSAVALYLTASTGIVGLIRQNDSQVKGVSAPTYSFTTGTWHHIVLVGTGSELRLYVNGSLQDTEGYTDIDASDSGYFLGASGALTSHFDGMIDEFGFWSDPGFGISTVADQFTAALYHSGTGRFPL